MNLILTEQCSAVSRNLDPLNGIQAFEKGEINGEVNKGSRMLSHLIICDKNIILEIGN
jgi:hypothetical protein